jgi:hypothetical protein|tara:strand:+ start:255 stop:746 length:492 start_codon:yes stop_codon:yes gene_type:complete
MSNFTHEEVLAITKALSKKEIDSARKDFQSGEEVDIDLVIRVAGKLKRGKAFESKGTSQIPWKVAMALLLKRSGFTGPQTARLLADAIKDSIDMGKDSKTELLKESGVGDALALIDRELFSKLPKIQKDGNITFSAMLVEPVRVPTLVVDDDTESLGEVEEVA